MSSVLKADSQIFLLVFDVFENILLSIWCALIWKWNLPIWTSDLIRSRSTSAMNHIPSKMPIWWLNWERNWWKHCNHWALLRHSTRWSFCTPFWIFFCYYAFVFTKWEMYLKPFWVCKYSRSTQKNVDMLLLCCFSWFVTKWISAWFLRCKMFTKFIKKG